MNKAGLFSAVNSAFIVGMQPNPGDTTNMLMLELIKIVADQNAVHDISSLSSSTGYSSSNIWMQTLAYASLSFSLLAAFGAVMGKQWLNSYKSAWGEGSIEDRSLRRQRKLDGLENWRLQWALGAFLVLLQMSLLLFGLSLSANMFTRQRTISSVIICTTALGILLYMATILVSALHPDSPFQTAGSTLIRAIYNKYSEFIEYLYWNTDFMDHFLERLRVSFPSTLNQSNKSSAIRWILETSTDPKVVEAAAAMVPFEQWPPNFDASIIFERLRTFRAYPGSSLELCVKYVKAMAHLCSQSVTLDGVFLGLNEDMWKCGGGKGRFIHDAFMAGHIAWDQSKGKDWNEQNHMANARTALRTIIVHGRRGYLSRPDDEKVIWDGDLRWRHRDGTTPSYEEFDWLIDYLAAGGTDDETEGDALLALSAMRGLGSSSKRHSYVDVLVRCMDPTRPSRVRNAALRAVSDASEELASMTCGSMPQGVDATLLDRLSRALSSVVPPSHNQTMQDSSPDTQFIDRRDCCYLRLIFILVQDGEWYNRLARDDHIERCISLYDKVLTSSLILDKVYLSGILLRMNPASKDTLNLAREKWWTLIKRAWRNISRYYISDNEIEALPILMAATRQHLPGPHSTDVARAELAALATNVHGALECLKDREDTRRWQDRGIMTLVDAALPTVQGLYDDLSSYAEH